MHLFIHLKCLKFLYVCILMRTFAQFKNCISMYFDVYVCTHYVCDLLKFFTNKPLKKTEKQTNKDNNKDSDDDNDKR